MIVKRGSRYGVRVYDRSLGGKRWCGTYSTLREAREVERREANRQGAVGIETCGRFAERWLLDYPRKAASSRRTYAYGIRGFASDFSKVRLADLDRVRARTWALQQPQSNVRVVRAMLNDAINDGLHPGPNPFANLRLEQSRGRRDLTAITEVELQALGDTALEVHGDFGPVFRAIVLFAGYVGLRPGELCALERRDIGQDEVQIRQNLDGTNELKLPKNGRPRVVILPPPAREALAEVPARVDVPWVFYTRRGKRFSKSNLHYYWRPVRAAFGRPEMEFYELRHFCATHLLELGVSHADVSVQLGHRDGGALVMSTYGHPSEDGARERLKRAYQTNVATFAPRQAGSQTGRGSS